MMTVFIGERGEGKGMELYPEMPKKRFSARLRNAGRKGKEAAVRSLWRMPLAAAFFLLSLAQCFTAPSPFALCCLIALLQSGERPGWPLAGLGAGLLFRVIWGLPLDVEQCAAAVLCCPLFGKRNWKPWALYGLAGMILLLRALPVMITAEESQTVIVNGISAALGLALLPALLRAGRLLRGKEKMDQDGALCLLLPVLLLAAGASRLWAYQINIGYLLSVYLVLLSAWLCGSSVSVCIGMGCGLSLLLGGQSALLLISLSFGGLLAGLLQGKNRLLAAGMFCLSAVTAAYLVSFAFNGAMLGTEAAAGLLFCLTPSKWTRRAARQIRQLKWSEPKENAYTRLKMQRWVRSIDRIADALPKPRISPATEEEEREALSEALCESCDRLPICWHEQREETREGLQALAERGEDTEEYLQIINQYFSACPRISQIPLLLSRLDEDRQRRGEKAVCADYERDMLCTHLTALSQAAQRISLEGMSGDSEESEWTRQAEETLEDTHFPGETAFVKRVDGHMTVCLKCDPLSVCPTDSELLRKQLSLQLHVPLAITERQGGRIVLEEEPPLRVVTGMATACAVTPEIKRKTGRHPDNGDAVLTQSLSGGLELLALSDGMGHGAGAQDESRKTLELLSLCLEAGYTRSQAMTAVNGAMLSATGGEKFATVDMCLVDLWTGETAMNKLGACASFILQGQKIHTVEGAALPLGIIEHVTPMEHSFVLGEGDMLLFMSDGVTDALEEEEVLELLRTNRDEAPQKLADTLLREALLQRDGLPPDDMTVLCARVEEREKRRSILGERAS